MRNSAIAWCHHTWNPIVGCSALHCEVAQECYADRQVERFGGDFSIVRPTGPKNWSDPYTWDEEARAEDKCARVFCQSMGDFFDPQADGIRTTAWPVIKDCQNLVFMILTKVPERIKDHLPPDWGAGYRNVWLGTSISSNHRKILERLDHVRKIPAIQRFVSAEPLRGSLTGIDLTGFGLLIVGGESGPKWKEHEMQLSWAKEAYDIAEAAGAKFFFKQVSAKQDEQGIDALGELIPPYERRVIREIPVGLFPWMDIEEKGDRVTDKQGSRTEAANATNNGSSAGSLIQIQAAPQGVSR